MRKETSYSGWKRSSLFLSSLFWAALVLAVMAQACGGSSKDASEPKQANTEEEATQTLAQAIEAEKTGQASVAEEKYARARKLRPQHLETA
jgi:hypothetical protein